MDIDPEIDDGGLRFSEKNYHNPVCSDGEDSDVENVGEDCDDHTEEGKSNGKGESGRDMKDKKKVDSKKRVGDLEEENAGGFGDVFETDWFSRLEGKNMKTLTLEDIKDISFRTIKEAEQFYSYYSFIMGFSIRKNKVERGIMDGAEVITRRSWNCSKEGHCQQFKNEKQPPLEAGGQKKQRNAFSNKCKGKKKDVPREIKYSRTGCKAVLWVKLMKDCGLYYATKFETEHNHELAEVHERYMLRSHRHVTMQDLYEVQALIEAQVSTSAAYDFILNQAGGPEFVGFLLKDLYNRLDAQRKKDKKHSDAEAALNWMRMKGQEDPLFFARFTKDDEGRLSNLFWRDSTSLMDYQAYGDVLIVDSTYKTNIYGMPFVMFVGANNHRGTVLFACALLSDEKEETYAWVIQKFLASMNNIPPKAIVTDGDEAMRKVMLKYMPNAPHRLCAWHIGRNVGQNVKNVQVQKKLGRLIYASCSIPEWEDEWESMILEHALQESGWLKQLYDKRHRWAEAFCKGHFYGGMCSTQRCEGMNSKAKRKVGRFTRLGDFVARFGRSIDRLRDRVVVDNFKSKGHTRKFNTHMKSLEEEAFNTFTDDIFLVIKGQIMFENKFFVSNRIMFGESTNMMVYVGQYDQPARLWSVACTLDSSSGDVTYECNCKLFESDGIPCCHIFCVLKAERVMTYPKSLICKRWMKSGPVSGRSKSCGAGDDAASRVMRYTALIGAAKRVCHNMSHSAEGFEKMMADLETLGDNSLKYRCTKKARVIENLSENVVMDPVIARTKGMPANVPLNNNANGGEATRGCSKCGIPGHNVRTCPLLKEEVLGSKGKNIECVSEAPEDKSQNRKSCGGVRKEMDEENLEVPSPSAVGRHLQASFKAGFDLNESTSNSNNHIPDLNSQVADGTERDPWLDILNWG